MDVSRRTFLGASALGAGAVALSGSLWRGASGSVSTVPGPYGALLFANHDGLRLPRGFTSRIVARSAEPVASTSYRWHPAPDGGACFPDGPGWIYVSNSEVSDDGGASAIRFGADGCVTDAYRILDGTDRNCAGGATPWGTWLSCEEVSLGLVHETDPRGERDAVARPAMGCFTHEAAAVDPIRRVVYLTEDEPDGCFYRFRPDEWPDLAAGTLEVLCEEGADGRVTWARVPDPGRRQRWTRYEVPDAKRFDGGEGAWFGDDCCWFTSKGDGRVWRYDGASDHLAVVYDDTGAAASLRGADNITSFGEGEVFVAEAGPDMQLRLLTEAGEIAPFLQVIGHDHSEVTGPAFSPDGARLYFSSQRGAGGGDADGITYEVTGPFHARRRPGARGSGSSLKGGRHQVPE